MIYRHFKKPLDGELKKDKWKSRLSCLDHQNIKKALTMLQETKGSFTSKLAQVVI